ncbi:MAG TPA: hypothetical protein VEB65_01920 [Solirubrobacterales bacterium]|nr:hypothetical protein [Solirubrobacterales bacterium]
MARKRGIKGKLVDIWVPEWEPLLDLAPAHVADFMWMGSVELRDKTRLQLYKHYWTRDYLHLDGDGRAFIHTEPQRYREIEPAWLLARVLDEYLADKNWFDWLRPRFPEPEEVRVEWTDSATKNGISHERSEYVVKHCGLHYRHGPPHGTEAPRPREFRTLFLGVDEDGVELEVAAVAGEYGEGFVVFHAAEMRQGYTDLLIRAERWRQ